MSEEDRSKSHGSSASGSPVDAALAPVMQTIRAGMVVGGYRLIAPIGSGGMGQVWRAVNVTVETVVRAVKVIRPEFSTHQDFQARFLREAALLSGLDHPNVLRFLDVGSVEGTLYLAMELLEGQPVDALLKEKGPLPADLVAQIGAQALAGVAAAHGRGIIHRDLKPANLFLRTDGVVKVLDFGIAKALAGDSTITQTQAASLIGTLPYMAPEFLDDVPASPASDVYAMGISLFQLSAGKLPFTASNAPASAAAAMILLQHVQKPLPDLRSIRPDLPVALVEAIEHATAKRPEGRPTAAELAVRLGALARPASIPKLPSTPTPPVTLPVAPRRRPWSWLLGVIGFCALATAVGIPVWRQLNAPATSPGASPTPRAVVIPTEDVAFKEGSEVGADAQVRDGQWGTGRYRFVPEGYFEMGCVPGDPECGWGETPPHMEKVGSFWMGLTEVTVEDYKTCRRVGLCDEPRPTSHQECNWAIPSRNFFPMNCVSWEEASKFCRGVVGGRLPTAAEWEYAAKSGQQRIYPWGNHPPDIALSVFGSPRTATAQVGTHRPGANAWGLEDLAGNVWEWTSSHFPGGSSDYQIRGGGWRSKPGELRNSTVEGAEPGRSTDDLGFRCIVPVTPTER